MVEVVRGSADGRGDGGVARPHDDGNRPASSGAKAVRRHMNSPVAKSHILDIFTSFGFKASYENGARNLLNTWLELIIDTSLEFRA
jgi:hypothetical protein